MQVAGDPEALVLRGQAGKLRLRIGERVIATHQLKDNECHDRGDWDRDRAPIKEQWPAASNDDESGNSPAPRAPSVARSRVPRTAASCMSAK